MKKSQRWKHKLKSLLIGRAKDNKKHKIHGRKKI